MAAGASVVAMGVFAETMGVIISLQWIDCYSLREVMQGWTEYLPRNLFDVAKSSDAME